MTRMPRPHPPARSRSPQSTDGKPRAGDAARRASSRAMHDGHTRQGSSPRRNNSSSARGPAPRACRTCRGLGALAAPRSAVRRGASAR
eukprot:4527691-Prymnesium_polylepis.1